jgi:hypothetical protein
MHKRPAQASCSSAVGCSSGTVATVARPAYRRNGKRGLRAEVPAAEPLALPELAHHGNGILHGAASAAALVRLAHRASAPGTSWVMVWHACDPRELRAAAKSASLPCERDWW